MKDMTLLITGGTHGLGLAIARCLAARGGTVLLHSRRTSSTQLAAIGRELVERLGARRVDCYLADLTDPVEISAMFERIHDAHPQIDYLVNNAGVLLRKPLAETSGEEFSELFALNATAPALCIGHAVKMGCRRVVNVADIAWNKSWKNHGAYVASKAALAALTRVAAVEWAPDVQINAVAPGLVTVPDGMEDTYAAVEGRIPAGRRGTPEEVARAVEMLLDAPSYMTGQVVAVDGGLSLR